MKVLVTGAHFTPAIAVIEQLKKFPVDIVYVGRKSTQEGDKSPSVESKILPAMGIRFIPILAGRIQRSFSIYTLPALLKIPVGFLQALRILLKEKPQMILSFGGYVSVPVTVVAWFLSIPIIIHEQSLTMGLANRINSIFAQKIAISFKNDEDVNTGKTILTGNPLRSDIVNHKNMRKKIGREPLILITGGNQGSHKINRAVEECLTDLTGLAYIIHVTGENKFMDYERLLKFSGKKYIVKKWIDKEWVRVLQSADIVISRAGINTLTELAFLGKPALVIPLKDFFNNEQEKNAKYFEQLGLIKILPQDRLSGLVLFRNIQKMLNSIDILKKNARKARNVVIPQAAERLALETILLTGAKI